MAEYPDAHGNGWKEWSKYVLKELDRLNDECKLYAQEHRKVAIDIAMLKVKAGIWGAVGGAIPAVVGLAFWLIKGAK